MDCLKFEKVVDKIERKYEAVVEMSIKARALAEGEVAVEPEQEVKITKKALNEYLREKHLDEFEEASTEKAE